ncbi:unnamed protein product, partial [Polarella glacialis]
MPLQASCTALPIRRLRAKVKADSVDKMPSFEYYPFKDGEWKDVGLRALLGTFVDESVLPYVRARYSREETALADILVRRYRPGERRTHSVHFDGHAFVTAVLGLSAPADYKGGLYVQPGPGVSTRRFCHLEPGDLLVHSFDLQHGVHVWEGVRYSMVFWFKDCAASVQAGTTPWYEELASAGDADNSNSSNNNYNNKNNNNSNSNNTDNNKNNNKNNSNNNNYNDADALYNLAVQYEYGLHGTPLDLERALDTYERSAKLGHHFAQNNLGLLLRDCGEVDSDFKGPMDWVAAAAEAGFAVAQKNLALMLAYGEVVEQEEAAAVLWMRRAAAQFEPEAAYYVGEFHRQGFGGLEQDSAAAAQWYELSASWGFPTANYELGMLYLDDLAEAEAERCFEAAAAQGHLESRNNLAKLRMQRGLCEEAVALWRELAEEEGQADALYSLGLCHLRGDGVPAPDRAEARRFLNLAEEAGSSQAAELLAGMAIE